jgi:hypothetical protein
VSYDPAKERFASIRDLFDARKKAIASSKEWRTEKELGRVKVGVGVEKSMELISGDYKFPANWKELSRKRSDLVKLSAAEQAIMKALNTVIPVDYDRMNLQDVLDDLRKRTGLSISADKKAIEEAGVTYDTPVTLKSNTYTLRSILKKINGELGLAYVVKDEAILITSQAQANRMTVTKTYYLGDMVAVTGPGIGPITSQLLMAERVNMIIGLIVNNVDRGSWKVNNPDAVGTVTFNPLNMTLIITQTAEFHMVNFSRR